MKLDRAELIRLIEARPYEGFWKSNPGTEWFPISLGSGIAIVVIVSMGLNANVMVVTGKTRDLYWLFGGVVFGGLISGIGIFNLTRRKRYEVLMAKYKDEILAEDLVEALHFTNRWKAGMAIADELYLPQKEFGFGMVWLACQCGNRRFAESYRVLVGMEDGREVLELMRKAHLRVQHSDFLLGCWILPMYSSSRISNFVSKTIWNDPVVAAGNQKFVQGSIFLFFGVILCGMLLRHHWLGAEERDSRPYVRKLSVEDLKVLVGRGRLGRIAKAVLDSR